MAERLELVLQAFENNAFTSALDALQGAQQAHQEAEHRLRKIVYKNRKDYNSSPSDVSMHVELALQNAEDMLSGKELKRYAASQRKQNEQDERENDFLQLCADEVLQLDDVSRWAIRRHIGKAVRGRDAMLGGVMTSLGHLNAVDGKLKQSPYELLTVFSRYGVITAALNDGEGLRMESRDRAILTATTSYSLGTLSLASQNMLITDASLSLEAAELDVKNAASTGDWADILKFGVQKTTDLPTFILGNPVYGPRIADRYLMAENEAFYDDIVEKTRLVANLAVGAMTLDDPDLGRFKINPKL